MGKNHGGRLKRKGLLSVRKNHTHDRSNWTTFKAVQINSGISCAYSLLRRQENSFLIVQSNLYTRAAVVISLSSHSDWFEKMREILATLIPAFRKHLAFIQGEELSLFFLYFYISKTCDVVFF